MYIVLEGVVGTGKSTQSKLLQKYMEEQYPGKEVLLVREPGGTIIAESIRTLVQATDFDEKMHPLTDVYLYAAARAQLLHTVVKPALEKGSVVISDRNVCSSLSYQGHTQGLGIERVREINQQAVKEVMPDIIFFMDLDVATGLGRTFDADGDKWEREQQDFFEQAYVGYESLFGFPPFTDLIHRINAHGTKEEVFSRLIQVIEK